MLFSINQQLLLIQPAEELNARWHSLEKRLKRSAKVAEKCPCDDAFLEEIRQQLKDWEQSGGGEDNHDLRNRMAQVEKSLDDLTVLDLWRNIQIRRYNMAFILLGLVLTVALLVFVMIFPPFEIRGGAGGSGGAYTAAGLTLSGAFGAVLSALAPGGPPVATGVPQSAAVSAMRPVAGAAAGLFLYLIDAAGLLYVDDVALHVLAVGLGFGERPFSKLLGGIAARSDAAIKARIVLIHKEEHCR